ICFCSAVAVLPLLHSFPTRRSSDLEKFRKDRGRQYDEQRYPRGDRTLSRIDLWMVQRGDDLAWKTRKILFLCCPRICCSFVCFRSEEHTSELQSRFDLVCRLLLEKK